MRGLKIDWLLTYRRQRSGTGDHRHPASVANRIESKYNVDGSQAAPENRHRIIRTDHRQTLTERKWIANEAMLTGKAVAVTRRPSAHREDRVINRFVQPIVGIEHKFSPHTKRAYHRLVHNLNLPADPAKLSNACLRRGCKIVAVDGAWKKFCAIALRP